MRVAYLIFIGLIFSVPAHAYLDDSTLLVPADGSEGFDNDFEVPDWLKDKEFAEVIANDIGLRKEIWELSLEHNDIKHLVIAYTKEFQELKERVEKDSEGLSEEDVAALWEEDLRQGRKALNDKINLYIEHHQRHVDEIKNENGDAVDAANKAAQRASQRFADFVSVLMLILGVMGLLAGAFVWSVQSNLNKFTKAKKQVDRFEDLSEKKFRELDFLRMESKLTLLLLDIKDNYRLHVEKVASQREADKASLQFLRSYLNEMSDKALRLCDDIKAHCEKFKEGKDKVDSLEENEGNISSCLAILGAVKYHTFIEKRKDGRCSKDNVDYHLMEAYRYFSRAKEHNAERLPDRAYNVGCIAALLWDITGSKDYFEQVIDTYVFLKKFHGKEKAFLGDSDVVPINLVVKRALDERKIWL